MKTIGAKELVKMLTDYKASYYAGNPTCTDEEYDIIEEDLRKIDPTNAYFNLVGAPVGNIKQKHAHINPMLSLAKAKNADEMNKWLEKINAEKEEIVVMGKIDGMSGSVIYKNGKLDKITSRGNGIVGQIISHVANGMNIPKTIPLKGDVEIRGEIFLPKNTPMDTAGSPLRNLAVGIVNAKESGIDKIKFLHFITYQIIGSDIAKESDKLIWLKKNGFEVVEYKVVSGKDEIGNYFDSYVSKLREQWIFESDGIVLTINNNAKWDKINSNYTISHHYYHNLAWKPLSEAAETTLEGIEWQLSRQSKLIPVAFFKPVVFGGRNVVRATLNNYDNVLKFNLHKGDRIVIKLANDVIPFFSDNLTKHNNVSKDLIPTHCSSLKLLGYISRAPIRSVKK